MKDAKEKILEISEGIDGLVNNAGLFVGGPLIEVSEKKMQKIIDVNVIGTYKVTKALYPLILARKGRIINIGSEAGRIAFPLNGPYSMSKFALEAFSDALRREVMFQGIKVVHLQAGAIKTDLLEKIYCTYAEDIDIEKTMFRNLIEQVIVTCEKELEKGSDPKHVAKAVYKALHKKRVKARYKVKNHKTRRLLEFLPTSIIDYAIMKMLK
ncbi:MAG: SDR family NAD(P)-dependent oxidoreductase [Candidatus Heimdallarchaeota archaeon]